MHALTETRDPLRGGVVCAINLYIDLLVVVASISTKYVLPGTLPGDGKLPD